MALLIFVYPWNLGYLYNKRVCPIKNEPQQGISYLEREREGVGGREGWEGVRDRGVGGWVGQQAGILKVYLGLGEIERRDRDTER
jgi:hypothetical protein